MNILLKLIFTLQGDSGDLFDDLLSVCDDLFDILDDEGVSLLSCIAASPSLR